MPGAFFTFVRLLALVAPYVAAAPIRHQPRQAANPKLVVAHVIVGNTASYSVETWKQDIQLAQANGIDGFALNVGFSAPFTNAQVQNAYVLFHKIRYGPPWVRGINV
jgi:glucan endo-1,3-alpha-glucosidase